MGSWPIVANQAGVTTRSLAAEAKLSDRSATWRAARHVLAVRLDNLGDVLMTTPALTALANAPGRRVTLVTSRSGAAVSGRVPALADLLVCDAPWVQGPAGAARDERHFIARLARRRFDAAVIFTVCTQSALPAALMCRLAGIPLRLAHSRENPYGLLTDWVPDREECRTGMRHEVQRQLDLVAQVGARADDDRLVFAVTATDRQALGQRLALAGGRPDRDWIVVHPGSSAPSRRYPAEHFGAAAAGIAARTGAQVVWAGGPDEVEAVERGRAAMAAPSLSLAGALPIGEFAALLAGARLVLCNNSGPAHLAAAVGAPVVVLYALTNPQHTPWRTPLRVLNHDVPCRDCLRSVCPEGHHACLRGVAPEAVAAAALALWHETARERDRALDPRTAP